MIERTNGPTWSRHRIRAIYSNRYLDSPAERLIPTEDWDRVVGMPYLVYMPEKDRVLMLVYRSTASSPA
jgi:hypothetical protein